MQEKREEQYRIRKCDILFYLEDDTVQVNEPRMDNSGIPQGEEKEDLAVVDYFSKICMRRYFYSQASDPSSSTSGQPLPHCGGLQCGPPDGLP